MAILTDTYPKWSPAQGTTSIVTVEVVERFEYNGKQNVRVCVAISHTDDESAADGDRVSFLLSDATWQRQCQRGQYDDETVIGQALKIQRDANPNGGHPFWSLYPYGGAVATPAPVRAPKATAVRQPATNGAHGTASAPTVNRNDPDAMLDLYDQCVQAGGAFANAIGVTLGAPATVADALSCAATLFIECNRRGITTLRTPEPKAEPKAAPLPPAKPAAKAAKAAKAVQHVGPGLEDVPPADELPEFLRDDDDNLPW